MRQLKAVSGVRKLLSFQELQILIARSLTWLVCRSKTDHAASDQRTLVCALPPDRAVLENETILLAVKPCRS
jgi:hypothetical protein